MEKWNNKILTHDKLQTIEVITIIQAGWILLVC